MSKKQIEKIKVLKSEVVFLKKYIKRLEKGNV